MNRRTAQSARRGQAKRPSSGPCLKAFVSAEAGLRRSASPSRTLHQLHQQVGDVEATLRAIAELVQGRRTYPAGSLIGNCCTTDDRGIWLKGVPKVLASYLGQAPFLSSTPSAVPPLRDQALALVADCEIVHVMLKPSVDPEYRAMRRGESFVLPLVLGTKALLEHALAEAVRIESDAELVRKGATTIDSPIV